MNQIKLLGLVLTFAVTNASADGNVGPEYWSGTYLGAHFGAGAGTINQQFSDKSTTIQRSFPNPITTITSTGSGQRQGDITGSNIDIFVGYNVHPYNSKFVLGGQFEGTLFNNTTMRSSGIRNGQSISISKSGSTINSNTLINTTALSVMSTDLQSEV